MQAGLEDKIRKINHQYTENVKISLQNRSSMKQIDNYNQDLQRMRSEMTTNHLQTEQRYQQNQGIQYEQALAEPRKIKIELEKKYWEFWRILSISKKLVEDSIAELDGVVKKELSFS